MISRSQMNRQLYADGTGIAQLLKMQQGAAQDQLTEEQAFAMMPEGVKEAYNSMLQAGASPEEARRLISEQIAEMSRQSAMMSEQQMQGESQNIPEYYDRRLQILEPEQMREEMINPSMPGYAYGGLIGRQQYGLGSLVKSVGKAVKSVGKTVGKIASSDVGKLALLAAGGYYLGGGALMGGPGFSFGQLGTSLASPFSGLQKGLMGTSLAGSGAASQGLLGKLGLTAGYGGGLSSGILGSLGGKIGAGTLLAGGLGLAAGSMLSPQQIQEGMKRNPEAVRSYLRQYYINTNPEATESEAEQYASEQTREYAAEGGIMGRQNYGLGSLVSNLLKDPAIVKQIEMASPIKQHLKQYYSNVNPGKSVEEIEAFVRENAAYGGPMGELRTNQEGVKEIDYRQTGGFVPPIGIKEKADDVPAMLSNNEFVFTADAVRNAGGGDVNKGAQKMYSLMKTLENGGMA
jgi:hypothetical protein